MILGDSAFDGFYRLSEWLYVKTRQTHAIAHERMVHLLYDYLLETGHAEADVAAVLIADYRATGGRSRLRFESADAELPLPKPAKAKKHTPDRQARHLQA
jgi:hypothetical protein